MFVYDPPEGWKVVKYLLYHFCFVANFSWLIRFDYGKHLVYCKIQIKKEMVKLFCFLFFLLNFGLLVTDETKRSELSPLLNICLELLS